MMPWLNFVVVVPTPTNLDWNDVQQSWLEFKRKVRWRTHFYSDNIVRKEREIGLLDAPYQKSVKNLHQRMFRP